jgi:hypothetical protein
MIDLSKSVRRAGVNLSPDARPATAAEGRAFTATLNSVGADYLKTVGLTLLRGRPFTAVEAMHHPSPRVAIVDEVLANKLWPEGNALGQQIQFGTKTAPGAKSSDAAKAPIEIVGIVPYTRNGLFEGEGNGALSPVCRRLQSNVFFHQFASNGGDAVPRNSDPSHRQ